MRDIFDLRLARSAPDLWPMLDRLYADHPDNQTMQDTLLKDMRAAWKARPEDLKAQDLQRDLEPDWFQRPNMLGYVFYIDRFARDLSGVHEKLDYLQSLGVTYVHLMPCLKPRQGDSDGGYSVQDYRQINPDLGTMDDLQALSAQLRARGIALCIDMVLNHTAKEHDWAKRAAAGDPAKRDMYLFFDDDTQPNAYERDLIEIFPDTTPGSFTHYPDIDQWVWTTFNEHQWDLNWANPQVFLEIARIMLFLANKGVDVLRLDAVAFMWKRMGTRCQSQPEVYLILRALRAVTRICATSVLHLEEAIVGPAEMLTYLGRGEHDGRIGNLAYHNSLMVQFWGALATRNTDLMGHVIATHFPDTLSNATYATYIRCHDDIGWAITDQDAGALGFSGPAHRAYLSDFYEGTFEGTFARGALFQENPATGDKRISGTFASLAGLELAIANDDTTAIDHAINRILLGNALIASFGGIPMIFMGDEIGLTNDYGYLHVPEHAHDSRWIHRPQMDWDRVASADADPTQPHARILNGTRHIFAARAATPQLHSAHPCHVQSTGNPAIFAFQRIAPDSTLLCLFNFTETWQQVDQHWLRDNGVTRFHDALSDMSIDPRDDTLAMPPYGCVWLT